MMGVGLSRPANSGVYVPNFRAGLSADSLTGVMMLGDSHTGAYSTWAAMLRDTLKARYGDGGNGYVNIGFGSPATDYANYGKRSQDYNGWISQKYISSSDVESYYLNVNTAKTFSAVSANEYAGWALNDAAKTDYTVWSGDSVTISAYSAGGFKQNVWPRIGKTYRYKIVVRSDSSAGGNFYLRLYDQTDFKFTFTIPASRTTDSTLTGTFVATRSGATILWLYGTSTAHYKAVLKQFSVSEYEPDNSHFDIPCSGVNSAVGLTTNSTMTMDSIGGGNIGIIYAQDSVAGSFQTSVDGGSYFYIRADSGAFLRKDTTITGLSQTTRHKIAFRTAATTGATVLGIRGWNQKGIIVDNLAKGGFECLQYLSVDSSTFHASVQFMHPKLSIIMLGTNECNMNMTPAAFQSNMMRIANKIKAAAPSSDVVIVSSIDNGLVGVSYSMAQYADAARAAAAASGVQFIDLYARFPKYADAVALGLMNNSNHPNVAGHVVIFGIIKQALGL